MPGAKLTDSDGDWVVICSSFQMQKKQFGPAILPLANNIKLVETLGFEALLTLMIAEFLKSSKQERHHKIESIELGKKTISHLPIYGW